MPRDARAAALEILRRVETGDAWASVLLRESDVSGRDRALATELVYGVLRRRMWLDHVIGVFASRPLDAIDLPLLLILRIAVYQILFLDRIPDHAAVSEAVSGARAIARGGKAGAAFVNGLLRSMLRGRDRIPAVPVAVPVPDGRTDPAKTLALAASHPEWLVRRWIERLGLEETAKLLAAANVPAPMALRANRLRTDPAALAGRLRGEGVLTRPSSLLDGFLVVEEGNAWRTRAFDEGLFYIQDEAAGLVASTIRAERGMRILDACAAPGGKALALAEILGAQGQVVAADRHVSRLRLLAENARRLGVRCAALAADMAQAAPLRESARFDVVLVDAPCTGTGVIRRHPELRYRLEPEDISRLAAIQSALLSRCAGLVRPGGALVYAVCSLEPEEGPERVAALLAQRPELRAETPAVPPGCDALVAATPAGPALVTLPHRDATDGFFAMTLRRPG